MPCKIKIKDLYVYDLFIDSEGKVTLIEYDKEKYYIFESGAAAEKVKKILIRELNIPDEEIKIFMVEK